MLASIGIDLPTAILLVLALGLALGFEFVNGFHDTANAVATVIYTNSLKPVYAVIWSGCWNLIGVLWSSGAVAFSIVALLPVELVINVGSGAGFAMVFSLLLSAIIWNLGTWYLGLPASSSHTLIGSIVGVGLMNSLLAPDSAFGDGVNWGKVADTLKALIASPLIGFLLAGLLVIIFKKVFSKALFEAPKGKSPPPPWIRGLLILTCTGVSFAHGSNDGQKGMGLIVLILVGVVPATYSLRMNTPPATIAAIHADAVTFEQQWQKAGPATPSTDLVAARKVLTGYLRKDPLTRATVDAVGSVNHSIIDITGRITDLSAIPPDERRNLRLNLYVVSESLAKMAKQKKLPAQFDAKATATYQGLLQDLTKYIPDWVKYAVALALGLGTMVGWKRIVVTVGEKIGKAHLTYGQGASAEIVAYATIQAADLLGQPVSTTHILSSGIAGTMVANKSGIQGDTVRNIILAWVLTLPVCVMLGAALFGAGLFFVLHILGVH
jgi:inorganic phosphate transporter, PiT family